MKKGSINLTSLHKKYAGKWVALADDEKTVRSFGKTAREALSKGKKSGTAAPILYKVPSKISLSISFSIVRK